MEQNKLEKQIKEKLNNRTIQPSSKAWDRLDAMLTVAEQPKKKFSWMYIAASFVGLMFVVFLFLNNQNIDNDVIVNKDSNKKLKNPHKVKISDDIDNTNLVQTKTAFKKNTVKEVYKKTQILKEEEIVVAKEKKQEGLNQNIIVVENKIKPNIEKLIAFEPTANSQQPTANNDQPTTSIKVDPTVLLSQVDGELTLTFREKIIKKYQSVKVALADRNNQK